MAAYRVQCAPMQHSDDTTFFLCSMERRQLTVSYAEPKNTEVQVQQQEQLLRQPSTQASKAVYVGNLPPGVTDQKLKEVFTAWGEVSERLLDSGIDSLCGHKKSQQTHSRYNVWLQVSKVVIPAATEKRPEQKFGFIHFVNQSSADKAVTDAAGGRKPRLGGTTLEVGPHVTPCAGAAVLVILWRACSEALATLADETPPVCR